MSISEKVAYLKGLADGLEISSESKEGKIIAAMIEVLDDMAEEITALNDNQLDIGDELDALSDDLADVEDFVFGPECCDEDECCDDECDDNCCCDDDDECCADDEDYSFEATCPECNSDIALTEEDLAKGSIVCPACGETLEFEFDGEEEED